VRPSPAPFDRRLGQRAFDAPGHGPVGRRPRAPQAGVRVGTAMGDVQIVSQSRRCGRELGVREEEM